MENETANQTSKDNDRPLKDEKTELEKDLVVWSAPARPFKRRDKQFYVTTISIAGMVCLVLFLAEGAMPVILIISLIFLYYVMSTVEPEIVEYKITSKGIKVGGNRIIWENLGRFWFGKRFDSELLIFETYAIPNRMELVIDIKVKQDIQNNLKNYLVEEEIPPSSLDKTIDWFTKKLPQ